VEHLNTVIYGGKHQCVNHPLISAIGVVAIPFGNPKFIGEAIIVELSFIALSVLVWQDYTKALMVVLRWQ
jgi:hypothetical protein